MGKELETSAAKDGSPYRILSKEVAWLHLHFKEGDKVNLV